MSFKKIKKGGFKMTNSNIGYIIVGFAMLSIARARKINAQLSAAIIGGDTDVFFSGDHGQAMTTNPLAADLFELSGFEIEAVQI